jgi:DNA-binding NarL/FixJ family response regulator
MSNESILLVDDEHIILASLSWVLEKNDFKVTTASSGQEAIENLKTRHYDLVITDLLMPKVDGIAVLQQAKSIYPDIGVIILTGYADISSAVATLTMGADDYLQKPCDNSDLIYKARRCFEKQNLITQLHDQNKQLKAEIASRKDIELKLQASHTNLEHQVQERTAELTDTVNKLKSALNILVTKENELETKNQELHDINTTLNILLKRREQEHAQIRKEMATKTLEMVIPLLKKAQSKVSGPARQYIETAHLNLLDLFSRHRNDTVLINAKLAPREMQIVTYIRQNKTTKEIAHSLGLKVSTVESYRENIRDKLRIKNQKINLKKFLTSIN